LAGGREIIAEDDGTDPARGGGGGEIATEHKVDVAFGTLFSHVDGLGAAPAS
jgi:branched-chain amino acid transport system substrate-binding protein